MSPHKRALLGLFPSLEKPGLAGGIQPSVRRLYAIPYTTRGERECVVSLSNPGSTNISGRFYVYGDGCAVVHEEAVRLAPGCTSLTRLLEYTGSRSGHCVVAMDGPVVIRTITLDGDGAAAGGELFGRESRLAWWRTRDKSRTYGFGYYLDPQRPDLGYLSVANPYDREVKGVVAWFDAKCTYLGNEPFRLKGGCALDLKFPDNRQGLGKLEVSGPLVMSVVHVTPGGGSSIEGISEANRIDGHAVPKPQARNRVLFEGRLPPEFEAVNTGYWGQLKSDLGDAGYNVAHHTEGPVNADVLLTCDIYVAVGWMSYSTEECIALVEFAGAGGGLLMAHEFGDAYNWTTSPLLPAMGVTRDLNTVTDPSHFDVQPSWVRYDAGRNFPGHAITDGVDEIILRAAGSMSTTDVWETVVLTDAGATPPSRSVASASALGAGRAFVVLDTNVFAPELSTGDSYDNRKFTLRIFDWLAFKL